LIDLVLSKALLALAVQTREIWAESERANYAYPVVSNRRALAEFAGSAHAYEEMEEYWVEYAKERLAALRGPLDLLSGTLPQDTIYRSPLLERLRHQVDLVVYSLARSS
jgi:hypothetical protein